MVSLSLSQIEEDAWSDIEYENVADQVEDSDCSEEETDSPVVLPAVEICEPIEAAAPTEVVAFVDDSSVVSEPEQDISEVRARLNTFIHGRILFDMS